ncbi:MAG: hypothetical protein ABI678_04210 [Kofleriaceae bacterium]
MPHELPPGSDTHPVVHRMMEDHWRRTSPALKLERMFAMGRSINDLARAELRQRYPEATPRELELRLRSRSLDRPTMIRVFGWDPDIHGR